MHANSKIPEVGTYGRVLQRYDRDPRHAHQMRYAGYDVNLRAVAAELGGKTAPTLFFPIGKDSAAERALRLGWKDVTAQWYQEFKIQGNPAKRKEFEHAQVAVRSMEWHDLRKYCSERGIDAGGKRQDIEARIIEWHKARLEQE